MILSIFLSWDIKHRSQRTISILRLDQLQDQSNSTSGYLRSLLTSTKLIYLHKKRKKFWNKKHISWNWKPVCTRIGRPFLFLLVVQLLLLRSKIWRWVGVCCLIFNFIVRSSRPIKTVISLLHGWMLYSMIIYSFNFLYFWAIFGYWDQRK